ncbi:MAG: tetratricopeptide repeat protein [Deltaproteobacteria bacterium]|nr:tetratricopeptide repeat protein [Deltaproteobacteria bacterium]MDQ3297992.1 hypothetical protein [Myxococcota bacterium]
MRNASSSVRLASRLLIPLALVLASCGGKKEAPKEDPSKLPAVPKVSDLVATDPGKPAATTITDAEAEKLGRELAAAMSKCDAAGIDAIIDSKAMHERSMAGLDPVMRAKLGGPISIGTALCAGLGTESKVSFSRIAREGGEPKPRLRGIVQGGVNFFEVVLQRKPDGSVSGVDIFSFRNGEMMSALLSMGAKFASDPAGAQSYVNATKLFAAGDHKGARKAFLEVPASLRTKVKAVALFGLSIDAKLDEATYQANMDAFVKQFPNDVSLPLIQIDSHTLRNEYPQLIEVLTELLKRSDQDPYVLSMRARAHLTAGNADKALADAKVAVAAEPTLSAATDVLVDAAVAAKNDDEAVRGLRAMVEQGLAKADLIAAMTADKQYHAFQKSAAYKAWVAETP